MTHFKDIPLLDPDPIFSVYRDFETDMRPDKINLGIGNYQTSDGKPYLPICVQEAEKRLWQKHLNKEYLPIEGDLEFLHAVLPLLLGPALPSIGPDRILAFQTIGGTGALSIGGGFLARFVNTPIYLPNPTWPNHLNIFKRCGLQIQSYPYLDKEKKQVQFDAMCQAVEQMPARSVVLLHVCCHNPTGYDLTVHQWEELSALMKKKQLIPFFDCAYQGFGDGVEQDVQAVRYFAHQGHEMLVSYSFAKNLGVYGERAGFLCFILDEGASSNAINSQIKSSIRGNYSNPPLHAARIVKTILNSPDLYKQWQDELNNMRGRIQDMRRALMSCLLIQHDLQDFADMQHQKGLFFLCDLTPEQVRQLRHEKGIYLLENGRINLAGLNSSNLNDVAASLAAMVKTK